MTFKAPPESKVPIACLKTTLTSHGQTAESLLDGNWNIHTAPEAIP